MLMLPYRSQYGAKDALIVVAATKCDIVTRSVSEEEGRKWASDHGFPFFEVIRQQHASIVHVIMHYLVD